MPVVTSGTGGTTNLVTRSPDEIAAQSGPFGTRSQTASGGSVDPAAARSSISGLLSGGLRSAPQAPTAASSIQFGTASAGKEDWQLWGLLAGLKKVDVWAADGWAADG